MRLMFLFILMLFIQGLVFGSNSKKYMPYSVQLFFGEMNSYICIYGKDKKNYILCLNAYRRINADDDLRKKLIGTWFQTIRTMDVPPSIVNTRTLVLQSNGQAVYRLEIRTRKTGYRLAKYLKGFWTITNNQQIILKLDGTI